MFPKRKSWRKGKGLRKCRQTDGAELKKWYGLFFWSNIDPISMSFIQLMSQQNKKGQINLKAGIYFV